MGFSCVGIFTFRLLLNHALKSRLSRNKSRRQVLHLSHFFEEGCVIEASLLGGVFAEPCSSNTRRWFQFNVFAHFCPTLFGTGLKPKTRVRLRLINHEIIADWCRFYMNFECLHMSVQNYRKLMNMVMCAFHRRGFFHFCPAIWWYLADFSSLIMWIIQVLYAMEFLRRFATTQSSKDTLKMLTNGNFCSVLLTFHIFNARNRIPNNMFQFEYWRGSPESSVLSASFA